MHDPPRETPRDESPSTAEPDHAQHPELDPGIDEPPLFQHPRWMVGVVMIFGVAAIVAGLSQPIWWLVGSPFILALLIMIWVRLRLR